MSNKRKKSRPEFKAKVALAAVKNEKTVSELPAKFGIHPTTMIHSWKRSLVDNAANVFDKGQKTQKTNEAKVDELYKQIGKLKVATDFWSEKLNF